MKNLQNFGVQELDTNSLMQIDGGSVAEQVGYAVGFVVGSIFGLAMNSVKLAIQML